jgi:hypothetical protein
MNDEPEAPAEASDATTETTTPFKEFLEAVHPSVVKRVEGLWLDKMRYNAIATPALRLHCPDCDGARTFRCEQDVPLEMNSSNQVFLTYLCGDCREDSKLFSLLIVPTNDAWQPGDAYKYEEFPPFGVPVPSKLLRLFGSDSQIFLKGRQCENQGLGMSRSSPPLITALHLSWIENERR